MNQWEKRTRRQYKSSGARQIEANCTHLPASSSEQPDASRPQGGQRISAFGAQRPNLIERQSEVSAGPVFRLNDPRERERERETGVIRCVNRGKLSYRVVLLPWETDWELRLQRTGGGLRLSSKNL